MGEAPAIQHTFPEWQHIWETLTGGRIHDPDGFREVRGDNLTYVDPDRAYSVEEFHQRLMGCTITPGRLL